ncbi:MAG: glycosyltransferase family 39 protein [Pseudomonadota bacterium]
MSRPINWTRWFIICAGALFIFRIFVLIFAQHELGPDETQYWFWSETPAFGYFSKPPVIAWAIAATTGFFGETEWAVRLSSSLFHLGTAALLFAAGRTLYDTETGFWTGVSWLLMPGVTISSAIISTDAALLFFWSAGLLALIRTAGDTARLSAVNISLLGFAIGFGLLSKYAMIYFLIGVALLPLLDARFRTSAFIISSFCATIIGFAVFSPNILWNMQNDFQTLAHTAANANWRDDLFHPIKLVEFLGGQFGLAGPLILLLAVFGARSAWRHRQNRDGWKGLMLLAFATPPILIVSIQALLSRAHANWAAASYPAATLLAVTLALKWVRAAKTTEKQTGTNSELRRRAVLILPASIALHANVLGVFSLAVIAPAGADALGLSGAFKRLRGWEEQGRVIATRAADFDAILCDDREVMGGVLYYAPTDKPVFAWESNSSIDHHYEAFHRHDGRGETRFLYVTPYSKAETALRRFKTINPLGYDTANLGGDRSRTLYFFHVEGRVEPRRKAVAAARAANAENNPAFSRKRLPGGD